MSHVHSFPAWVAGERKPHHKFGGPQIAGYELVSARLDMIHRQFPDDYTSLHSIHELKTEVFGARCFNSPSAVDFDTLTAKVGNGDWPRVNALTAPAFGWGNVHEGAILSPNADVVEIAFQLHVEAIIRSSMLEQNGLGLGNGIWWPAFDAMVRGIGVERGEAWYRMLEFWIRVLRETGGTIHLEYKPAVPADMDHINTLSRAIAFCNAVNAALGRIAMVLNNEWAHLTIGGMTVLEGTKLTIEAGLFTGFLHVNSAERASVVYSDKTGLIISGAPSDDKDWPVGVPWGDNATYNGWNDQQAAVGVIMADAKITGKKIVFEHDLDPMGEPPAEFYGVSRNNLEKMIAAETAS